MAVDVSREYRTERLQARATKQTKDLLEMAATMQGVTLSEFIISSALERAMETVREHNYLELSARDSRAFADALLNPQEPNKALRAARERYLAEVEP